MSYIIIDKLIILIYFNAALLDSCFDLDHFAGLNYHHHQPFKMLSAGAHAFLKDNT
jgi:hypothetical protein